MTEHEPAVRVLIVDDHPIVRTGVRALFDGSAEVDVVGEAGSGAEAVALARHLDPDVVLCDLRLGEGMDGIATTTALRGLRHPPAVIILTTFDRDAEVLGAIEAGAAGYLLKDVEPQVIVRAIRDAAAGGLVLAPQLGQRVAAAMRAPRVSLTDRERDVLRLLERGSSNREIARTLFVTEATVKTHLAHIFTKLGADSRARALVRVREMGLLE